ncbi:MAG: RNA polymerase sigma factor [Solirubrobacteraceae bacterium]
MAADARSDAELLIASRSDPSAFGEFYERHVGRILVFFRARVGSPEAALDLTAETFAAVLGGVGRYEPGEAPAASWLFGIARNKLSEAIREAQVQDRARRAMAMQPIEVDDEGVQLIEQRASAPALEMLGGLPPDQRAAVSARHLRELE